MKLAVLTGLTTIALCFTAKSELMTGSFQYMDFETAPSDLQTYPWSFGTSLTTGTSHVHTNGMFILIPIEQYSFHPSPIDPNSLFGNYALILGAGDVSYEGSNSYAEVYQTGLIPVSAKSIQLNSSPWYSKPKLYINDTEIALIENSPWSLSGDIEAWAGKNAELEIRIYADSDGYGQPAMIDNIAFSTEAIPEPSSIALIGCSAIVLFLNRNRKKYGRTRGWTLR